jgi:intracellular sulfur oxidation DsrE/DsrF family protein
MGPTKEAAMRLPVLLLIALIALPAQAADQGAKYEQTPYGEQKVVFDFYFDEPGKIKSALYWIRTTMKTLTDTPYNYPMEFLDFKVIVHGTEIVTLVKKNQDKYKDVVSRMQYYAQLGVDFRICSLAAEDYGYRREDFYDFVTMVPAAMPEIAHWQLQGYALITPKIMDKKYAIEEIR